MIKELIFNKSTSIILKIHYQLCFFEFIIMLESVLRNIYLHFEELV